jgi:hypothetical protein
LEKSLQTFQDLKKIKSNINSIKKILNSNL